MFEQDCQWMKQALQLAKQGQRAGEVPVGAVLIKDHQLIASAYNQPIAHCDPTAHAEMLVLRQAGQQLQNYRLIDTTLYVTLEPCAMCAAAIVHARIARIVFAAADPKTGAAGSVMNLFEHSALNHHPIITSGVMAEECGILLKDFFFARRKKIAMR